MNLLDSPKIVGKTYVLTLSFSSHQTLNHLAHTAAPGKSISDVRFYWAGTIRLDISPSLRYFTGRVWKSLQSRMIFGHSRFDVEWPTRRWPMNLQG